MDEQLIQFEIDRGVVQLKWLRFLQLRPEVANLPELHACANLNGWLRACGEKLVRPELFHKLVEARPHWQRETHEVNER
jgi:hypothetical protein